MPCPLDDPTSFVFYYLLSVSAGFTPPKPNISGLVFLLHHGSQCCKTVVCTCSCVEETARCRPMSRWLNVCRGSLDRASVCVPSAAGMDGWLLSSQRACENSLAFLRTNLAAPWISTCPSSARKASWLGKHLLGPLPRCRCWPRSTGSRKRGF